MAKQPTQDTAGQSDKTAAPGDAGAPPANDKRGHPVTPATPKADDAKGKSELTGADVAKAIQATVRVREKNKKGEFEVVERAAQASDILSFRVDAGEVIAVTVDGRKHRAEVGR